MLPNHLWPCDSNMGLLEVYCGVWHWKFGIWSFGFHQLKSEVLIELVPVNLTLPRSDWGNTEILLASFSWSWAVFFSYMGQVLLWGRLFLLVSATAEARGEGLGKGVAIFMSMEPKTSLYNLLSVLVPPAGVCSCIHREHLQIAETIHCKLHRVVLSNVFMQQ